MVFRSDPRRPTLAGLDYLALGDWHRTVQIGPSIWYSDRIPAARLWLGLIIWRLVTGTEPFRSGHPYGIREPRNRTVPVVRKLVRRSLWTFPVLVRPPRLSRTRSAPING